MLMTLSAAIGCIFLSGLAKPDLVGTGCGDDSEHSSCTARPAEVFGKDLPLLVTGAQDRVHTNVLHSGSGFRTGWGELAGNEVSGGTTAVLGDRLQRVVTDVTDHVQVTLLRRPSGLLIAYVLTF